MTKTYGAGDLAVAALRGVDLEVAFGELIMLVGPSGCGKTSLVSIIAGLLDPDDGTCAVLGCEQRLLEPARRARFRSENIGFVFQKVNLLPALSVVENISVPLLLAGAGRSEAEKRAMELAEAVGMGGRLSALPRQLSGGQQQRVAIARALANSPGLLICDEPTSALDHQSGQAVMELLRHVATSPERAVIVVTHDPRILAFADRIARMDDGRILGIEAAGFHA